MSVKDPTVAERVKRQRINRLSNGWREVRVWVPSIEDADTITRMAANMRRRKLNEDSFKRMDEMNKAPKLADFSDEELQDMLSNMQDEEQTVDNGEFVQESTSGWITRLITAVINERKEP